VLGTGSRPAVVTTHLAQSALASLSMSVMSSWWIFQPDEPLRKIK
jgi:hypothetical protein